MGLLYASSSTTADTSSDPTDFDREARELRTILKIGPNGKIVLSPGCCWCSWTLGDILNETSKHRIVSPLPETHSFIVPWVPPRGIPMRALQKLEERLMYRMFVRITGRSAVLYGRPEVAYSSIDDGPGDKSQMHFYNYTVYLNEKEDREKIYEGLE
ncbi:hypothetical protein BV25DRAFT_1830522 [Artomyces pyxidatus]|uniref:Uncharacterized protein n=1 Tax=Artomyces pyxidatus TaxID=48021 RepID=A0ACB8SPY7_9AGAM|nr:hypothetical protein BV25DRAFT_1830522 [Artomyces pyxidatus]